MLLYMQKDIKTEGENEKMNKADTYRLGEIEARFADIVWENAPIRSKDLVTICEKEIGWKRTTTYTVLKKFCNRGILKNEKAKVSVLIARDRFYAAKVQEFVDKSFGGSIVEFMKSYTFGKDVSDEDVKEITKILKK